MGKMKNKHRRLPLNFDFFRKSRQRLPIKILFPLGVQKSLAKFSLIGISLLFLVSTSYYILTQPEEVCAAGECSGDPWGCVAHSESQSDCVACGCTWEIAVCTGTPNPCNYAEQSDCERCGCDWILDNPPQYSLNETNSTIAGAGIEHRLKWTDDNALSGYIFSFHNGSDWKYSLETADKETGEISKNVDANGSLNTSYSSSYNYPLTYTENAGENNISDVNASDDVYASQEEDDANYMNVSWRYDSSCGGTSDYYDCGIFETSGECNAHSICGCSWADPPGTCIGTIDCDTLPGDSTCDATCGCDLTEASDTLLQAGDTITNVTITVKHWESDSDVDLKMNFYNATTWIAATAPAVCEGAECNYTYSLYDNGIDTVTEVNNLTISWRIEQSAGGGDIGYVDFFLLNVTNSSVVYYKTYDNATTYTTYSNVDTTNMENITNITVTVNVSDYDNTASGNASNSNPDLQLEIYNGSWTFINNLSVSTTGNVSLSTTDSNILDSWETPSNRDIRIRGNYMDWYDNNTIDMINWTDVWVSIDYTFEFKNDTWTDMIGTGNWSNVTKVVNSTEGATIKWIVYANDSADQWNKSLTYSYQTTAPPKLVHMNGIALYYYTGERVNGNVKVIPVENPENKMNTTVTNGEWSIDFDMISEDVQYLTFVIDDNEKIGYNYIKLDNDNPSTATLNCTTQNISLSGYSVNVNSGDQITSGNVRVSILDTDYTNTSSFTGTWSIDFYPCLVSGRIYTLQILISDNTGKRGMILQKYPAR